MHIKKYNEFLLENKTDDNLVRKYFNISMKTTYFKVPMEIFKTSDKAFLMGYKNEEGKEISTWLPKVGVTGPFTGPKYFPIQPNDVYQLAWWIVDGDDKKKTQFFIDYAKFTDIMINKENEKDFNKEIEMDNKINDYILDKLNSFFTFFDTDIVAQKVEIEDFEKFLYKVKTNYKDLIVMYRGDSYFRIDAGDYIIHLNKKLDKKDYIQYLDLLNLMKYFKADTTSLEKDIMNLFKESCKGYDKDYQYASHSSSRYAHGEYVDIFARELKKHGLEKEVKKEMAKCIK